MNTLTIGFLSPFTALFLFIEAMAFAYWRKLRKYERRKANVCYVVHLALMPVVLSSFFQPFHAFLLNFELVVTGIFATYIITIPIMISLSR
jgi:hypothetical protein